MSHTTQNQHYYLRFHRKNATTTAGITNATKMPIAKNKKGVSPASFSIGGVEVSFGVCVGVAVTVGVGSGSSPPLVG